jgi:hypothetical protein
MDEPISAEEAIEIAKREILDVYGPKRAEYSASLSTVGSRKDWFVHVRSLMNSSSAVTTLAPTSLWMER